MTAQGVIPGPALRKLRAKRAKRETATVEFWTAVKEALESGGSWRVVADELEMSMTTVRAQLTSYGLLPEEPKK